MKTIRILWVFVGTILLLGLLLNMFTAVYAAGITVNSNLDTADPMPADGVCDVDPGAAGNQCTLRAAIQTAQGVAGSDSIHFANSMDIALTSLLPVLTETDLTIEADSGQEVKIDAQDLPGNVFRISGNSVTISNVVVYGSGSDYSNIWVSNTSYGVVLANNLIGDDDPAPGGCGQSDNSYGGIYVSSTGTIADDIHRVWIYGNTIECFTGVNGQGISLVSTDKVHIGQHRVAGFPEVAGNIIRQNRTGIYSFNSVWNWISSNVVENNLENGLWMQSNSGLSWIGCYDPNTANPAGCRNVIRGNGEAGVYANGSNTGSVALVRNWIGLGDDGVTAVPNNIGVYLHTDNHETGVLSNTISGNIEDGIRVKESNGEHVIYGNVIGLGADGLTAVPNGSHGIALFDDAGRNTIGSLAAGIGNTISGNQGYGILVSNTPTTTIDINLIGLAQDGITQRGNGYSGVYAINSNRIQVGSLLATEEFYGTQKISGNGETGVYFKNVTEGYIGRTTDIINNNGAGVYIYNSQQNIIFAHLIADNDKQGMQLSGNSSAYNVFYPLEVRNNGNLPIDFGAPGLEPNDVNDTDNGPNHLLNVPEVTVTNGTVITGTVCASCYVLVYEALGDPTANGGGGIYRDVIPSDANGIWSIDLASIGLEQRPVSFVAVDNSGPSNNETSPFSPVTQVGYAVYLPMIVR